MHSQLDRVQNWPERARSSGYSASALAQNCRISVRQLERYFFDHFRRSPQQWLGELRLSRARELLRDGSTVKETAALLEYKNPTHFSHDFKKHYGMAPARYSSRNQSRLEK